MNITIGTKGVLINKKERVITLNKRVFDYSDKYVLINTDTNVSRTFILNTKYNGEDEKIYNCLEDESIVLVYM